MLKIKVLTDGADAKQRDTLLFAGEELKKYLSMSTSEPIILCEGGKETDGVILLGIGLSPDIKTVEDKKFDDAILVDIKESTGIITGSNARSVLIAAYRYLRELGYRFFRPGKNGEKCPTHLAKRDVYINEKPSYRHRSVCIEGSASYESVADMIDWLPKVGMNGYFIQFFIPMIFFKRWYEHKGYEFTNPYLAPEPLTVEDVDSMVKLLEREIRRRSLLYYKVGHGWTCEPFGMTSLGWEPVDPNTIPKENEKYFALVNGKRELHNTPLYHNVPMVTQLCYGNPEVRKKIVDYVIDYCKANPDIDVISFSMADGANAYCECELCRDTRPSDFKIMLINEIDKRMKAEGIDTKLSFSMYVDHLWPPQKNKVNNEENTLMVFCPISRSYTYPFPTKTDCGIREFNYNKLTFPSSVEELLAYVREWRKLYSGESYVFDYYYMWDCYKDLGATNTARVIRDDIRNYRELNLNGLVSCQSQRVFSPTSLGMNVMARTLWDRDCDFDAVRDEVLCAEYGEDYEAVRDYLQDLSVYSLPQVTRLEVPFDAPDNIAMYEMGLARARSFNAVINEHLAKAAGSEAVSWKYLKFHTAVSIMLFSAFIEIANGAEPIPLWKPIEDFVNRHELELAQYFDVFEFKYSYWRQVFKKLHDKKKELDIGV